MSLKVPSLERLTAELAKLPGIGVKTAERLALSLVKKDISEIQALREALLDIKEKIKECPSCYAYTESEGLCAFCSDEERQNKKLICIVKNPTDIAKIESSGAFKGLYHVLHGTIAPLEGIGPEDIKLNDFVERLQKLSEEGPVEVVVALDADIEGDTTSLYIKEILKDKNVEVTRLAHGVPIGSFIDFIDDRTLSRALENRIKL